MDIKTTSATTKTAEISNSSSSSATLAKDSATSFKDELQAAKTQDAKDSQNAQNAQATQDAQKNADDKAAQEVSKDQTQKADKTTDNSDKKVTDPLKELNAQLATLNGIKGIYNPQTNHFELKAEESSSKKDYGSTIKMDSKDINFFVNLVANQQMTAQSAQLNNMGINANNNSFNQIKSEATQQTVQVSATLMNALNESVKTNQPFRIDFGNDVAVIMKVNKDGQLSANFIPGSAAVEQYLRNNIESLRQSFNEQHLPYEQLSYSRQQNKEQNNQNNDKENDNE